MPFGSVSALSAEEFVALEQKYDITERPIGKSLSIFPALMPTFKFGWFDSEARKVPFMQGQ